VIEFFESCVPPKTTAQQKRMNRATGVFFHTEKQEAAIATYDQILAKHKPEKPEKGAITLTVEMTWPWLKSDGQKVRCHSKIPHTSKPDCSNIVKQIEDQIVKWRYIEDDSKIFTLFVRKWRGDRPGIYIQIEGTE
jgi:Holliday junction resolvase RusA-like endonuclease